MRHSVGWLFLLLAGLLVGAVPAAAPPKLSDNVPGANEKKLRLNVEDKLTEDDPKDDKKKDSFRKVHEVDLEAGTTYRIDMTSNSLDSYLRLLDPDGKEVAEDDDSGGGVDARIIYKAKRTATYKIVATTESENPRAKRTGSYHLTVRDAEPRDIVLDRLKHVLMAQPEASVKERGAVIGATIAMLLKEKTVTGQDASLVMQLAYMLDPLPTKDAVKFAGEIKTFLDRADDDRIKSAAGMFDSVIRRLELPGHAIEIKGTTLDGEALDWKAYRGKVVLVDFWATWCGPCRAEMPKLKILREKFGPAGFDIVGISADHADDAPAAYMKRNGYEWACIYEKATKVQPMVEHYGIIGFPTTILVGRDGRVLELNPDRSRLEQIVERHLEKKSPSSSAEK